ncbi:TPA: hypothetical protein R8E83_003556 [Escherichia coli]|nr:hypothetical protein [Escherichia coli]
MNKSTITKEQAQRLRNDFECWQQDYDPVADKEQYNMFGLGMVAMDALLAAMYASPSPVVREMLKALAPILDEDQFTRIENIAISAGVTPPEPVNHQYQKRTDNELLTDLHLNHLRAFDTGCVKNSAGTFNDTQLTDLIGSLEILARSPAWADSKDAQTMRSAAEHLRELLEHRASVLTALKTNVAGAVVKEMVKDCIKEIMRAQNLLEQKSGGEQ